MLLQRLPGGPALDHDQLLVVGVQRVQLTAVLFVDQRDGLLHGRDDLIPVLGLGGNGGDDNDGHGLLLELAWPWVRR